MSEVISSQGLLDMWQGNRGLTRRVIEAFPEKEFFEFSIGGMRTFADITQELLGIAVPGLTEIVGGEGRPLNEDLGVRSKAELLKLWDESTAAITDLWAKLPPARFPESVNLFGQYKGTVLSSILYFIENEIHHRGQGYVYLRAVGVEPPFFWER